VLDREMQMLNVGTTRGVITDFTVAPGIFMSGEVVTASLTLHNSGTVDLNGTLVVDVRDSEGVLVDNLSHIYMGLTPAQSASFEAEWHTPPDAFGPYYLTGYALYNSLVTDPEHQMASTPRVLLPMLLR